MCTWMEKVLSCGGHRALLVLLSLIIVVQGSVMCQRDAHNVEVALCGDVNHAFGNVEHQLREQGRNLASVKDSLHKGLLPQLEAKVKEHERVEHQLREQGRDLASAQASLHNGLASLEAKVKEHQVLLLHMQGDTLSSSQVTELQSQVKEHGHLLRQIPAHDASLQALAETQRVLGSRLDEAQRSLQALHHESVDRDDIGELTHHQGSDLTVFESRLQSVEGETRSLSAAMRSLASVDGEASNEGTIPSLASLQRALKRVQLVDGRLAEALQTGKVCNEHVKRLKVRIDSLQEEARQAEEDMAVMRSALKGALQLAHKLQNELYERMDVMLSLAGGLHGEQMGVIVDDADVDASD